MTSLKTTFVAALMALTTPFANAHDFKAGDLSIAHPHSFATPPGSATAAGYLEITNNGTEPDRLIGVDSGFPRTMIHRTESKDGVTKMRHQHGGVVIPAGETITFEPGGLHVMFMGLEEALKEGEKADATLHFENSGSVAVVFNVEKRKVTSKAVDHSNHSSHGTKKKHGTHQ